MFRFLDHVTNANVIWSVIWICLDSIKKVLETSFESALFCTSSRYSFVLFDLFEWLLGVSAFRKNYCRKYFYIFVFLSDTKYLYHFKKWKIWLISLLCCIASWMELRKNLNYIFAMLNWLNSAFDTFWLAFLTKLKFLYHSAKACVAQ